MTLGKGEDYHLQVNHLTIHVPSIHILQECRILGWGFGSIPPSFHQCSNHEDLILVADSLHCLRDQDLRSIKKAYYESV